MCHNASGGKGNGKVITMKTPVCDFVRDYIDKDVSRLHMPGHKGVNAFLGEAYDITEIKGADELYEASGIIAESEENASKLFGTGKTFYSAEGSSLCIKAMLYMIKLASPGEKTTVLAARNVHKAFVYGCGLLDIDVKWMWEREDDFSLCRCIITPEILKEELKRAEGKISAVYITSPDYLGGMSDIKSLSETAREYGVPLIVDNAHGAYLRFLKDSLHPIDLGADMCCDSAHKTLPVLTGGAYLHISENAPETYKNLGKKAMELFGSTSPSYLILQSLDKANEYMENGYKETLAACVKRVAKLKKDLNAAGIRIYESDPLKVTIINQGAKIGEILRKNGAECEYEDPDYTVLMLTPENTERDFERVYKALSELKPESYMRNPLTFKAPERKMSIRDALFSQSEKIKASDSFGRILAAPSVGCPPAVPAVVSGEVISKEAVEIFKYYCIDAVDVIK